MALVDFKTSPDILGIIDGYKWGRVDIRNYVLIYLWTLPKLAQFVVQGMVTLFSHIRHH